MKISMTIIVFTVVLSFLKQTSFFFSGMPADIMFLAWHTWKMYPIWIIGHIVMSWKRCANDTYLKKKMLYMLLCWRGYCTNQPRWLHQMNIMRISTATFFLGQFNKVSNGLIQNHFHDKGPVTFNFNFDSYKLIRNKF